MWRKEDNLQKPTWESRIGRGWQIMRRIYGSYGMKASGK